MIVKPPEAQRETSPVGLKNSPRASSVISPPRPIPTRAHSSGKYGSLLNKFLPPHAGRPANEAVSRAIAMRDSGSGWQRIVLILHPPCENAATKHRERDCDPPSGRADTASGSTGSNFAARAKKKGHGPWTVPLFLGVADDAKLTRRPSYE
jgi:hypothetical protein